MLYNPPAFRETDLQRLHDHIAATGFATLVTTGADGPLISHLPMLLDRSAGTYGRLTGHLARANSQWQASDLTKLAIAIFAGPDAYVTPSWYPSKQEHGRVVPTWNYSVVHARGLLEVFDDPEALATHVAALTAMHENRFEVPWNVTDAPQDFIRQRLKGVVGVRLAITAIEGKAKLSQNRGDDDQRSVIEGLSASDRPGDQATAALMKRLRNR